MNKKEVKIFDAYSVDDEDKKYYLDLGLDDYHLMEYHNCILKNNGTIKPSGPFTKHFKPIKPLDKKMIIESIEKTRNVITIEDGTIINGLGTAIKELIIDENLQNVKIKSYAYPDKFIKHGSVEELEKLYKLDETSILNEVKREKILCQI